MDENRSAIEQAFKDYDIKDWELSGNFMSGGQASVLEVKNLKDGTLGVFRLLKSNKPNDIQRFRRELDILVCTKHQNIIEILAVPETNDQYWYISRKGNQFQTYWRQQKEKFEDQPNDLFDKAITIVKEITEGLIPLHEQGVIHRDIKAKNLVVIDEKPIIIDFGIAFVTGEERLTDINEAVANKFSPDPSLNFLETVPPWLDIYLMSQLLIWMISEPTNKPQIQRPLDWRFVVYPENISLDRIAALRALTARCSEQDVAPQNAKEFHTLLDNMFRKEGDLNVSPSGDQLDSLLETIQKSRNKLMSRNQENRTLILSRLPDFEVIASQLGKMLNNFFSSLPTTIPVVINEAEISDFRKMISLEPNAKNLYWFHTRYILGQSPNSFQVILSYVFVSENSVRASAGNWKEIENKPSFRLQLNADNDQLALANKSSMYFLLPTADGRLEVYDANNSMHYLGIKDISEIYTMIKDSVLDKETWQLIH